MGARGPQPARQRVDGRWMTLVEVARMLGKHHNTLICYMADHPGIGCQVIADRYRAGEVHRGGIHPTKRHRVHGKLLGDEGSYCYWGDHIHTAYAYIAARRARFEHGEQPQLVPMNYKGRLKLLEAQKLFGAIV